MIDDKASFEQTDASLKAEQDVYEQGVQLARRKRAVNRAVHGIVTPPVSSGPPVPPLSPANVFHLLGVDQTPSQIQLPAIKTPPNMQSQHEAVWGYSQGSAFKKGRPLRAIWDGIESENPRIKPLPCESIFPHVQAHRARMAEEQKRKGEPLWRVPLTPEEVLEMYSDPTAWE